MLRSWCDKHHQQHVLSTVVIILLAGALGGLAVGSVSVWCVVYAVVLRYGCYRCLDVSNMDAVVLRYGCYRYVLLWLQPCCVIVESIPRD